jgi:hypothetical protein
MVDIKKLKNQLKALSRTQLEESFIRLYRLSCQKTKIICDLEAILKEGVKTDG